MKNNLKSFARKALVFVCAAVMTLGICACASKGQKITIEVTGPDGTTKSYTQKTEADNLLDAIDDFKNITVDGSFSEYGFYMTSVNGVEADWDADNAYWAVYVNGDYGQYSLDNQPITEGDTYSLVYEISYGQG